MPGRRFNCACGKKRYRDETSALAAAAADSAAHRVAASVYRCPGGLAWHVTAHGFIPEALKSVGRRLAYELAEHGQVDLDEFRTGLLTSGARLDERRLARVGQCAQQLTGLGLVVRDASRQDALGRLIAMDAPGLRRVVQVGLDAYQQEHL